MTTTPPDGVPPEAEEPTDPAEPADAADSAVPEGEADAETRRLIEDVEGYRE